MKKIDLTYQMRRATKKLSLPTAQSELLEKLKMSNSLLTNMNNIDTLKREVLKAMANYNGGTIEEAEEMLTLIEFLRDNPTCEITDEQFAMVEHAISNASVEVKATWKSMVNELNAE